MSDGHFVSISEAARVAGVSRQAIYKLKKKSSYNFWSSDRKSIDINSEEWKNYLHNHASLGPANNAPAKPRKPATGDPATDAPNLQYDKEKFFTGGYDSDNYPPMNLADLKRAAEINKLKLEMEVKTGNLIEREIVEKSFDSMGAALRNIVDIPRKSSAKICLELEAVGMEKEVEKILSRVIESELETVKKKLKDALREILK